VQKAELTRLSQTFLHVPQLHWIVVEDSPHKTPLVTDLMVKSGLTYTHLHMPTAKDRKLLEVGGDNNHISLNPPITFKFTNIFYPLNLQKIIRIYIFSKV